MKLLIAAMLLAAAPVPPDSLYQLRIPLQDQDGRSAALDRGRGHPVLLTMFYGDCPVACPLLISKIKLLERDLPAEARGALRVELVSLDPERDTPQKLHALAGLHAVDLARWSFFRTGPDHVRELAAGLGIKYHPLDSGGIWHSVELVLLDGEGRMVARAEGQDADLRPLAAQIVALQKSPQSGYIVRP
jgi:protein SCO1